MHAFFEKPCLAADGGEPGPESRPLFVESNLDALMAMNAFDSPDLWMAMHRYFVIVRPQFLER